MFINYFDKREFDLITASYNDEKVLHLDVTDVRKPILCPICRTIKMVVQEMETGIYYDADVSQNRDWKLLYITYNRISKYRCKKCGKTISQKGKIPCKRGVSPTLREQLVKMLVLSPSAKRKSWAKLIEEYTIYDFKDIAGKGEDPSPIQLLKKSRINTVLKNYREEYEKQIKGYSLHENVIFYPFMYEEKARGAIISCDKFEYTSSEQIKCTINGFRNVHSADDLYCFLLDKTSKDISTIQEVLISPLLFPLYKSAENITELNDAIMAEGIDFELYKIEDQIVGKQKTKNKENIDNRLRKLTGEFQDILASNGDFHSFKERMDAQFLCAESEWGNYYSELKDSYKNYPYPWFKNIAISNNREVSKLIKKLKKTIDRMQQKGITFHYIPAIFISEIVKAIPPIQTYSREMGTLKQPVGLQKSFNFVSATITMQRPVSDELFILPIANNSFAIIGFDETSYCGYDLLAGKSVETLIQHLGNLTIWEKTEIKTIYCPFDQELVYELRPVFPNAEFRVDLEEVVHAFVDNHIGNEGVQLVISTAIHAFDPEPQTIASRYPEWVVKRKPAIFEKIQPSPQKLLEINYCSKEEFDDLFEIYSRVSLAPELLDRYYTHGEIQKKYEEMKTFQTLAEQEVSAERYMEKVKNEGLPRCIEMPKDLMFHRMLMVYEDVEVDLDGFLRCLNELDECSDITPS